MQEISIRLFEGAYTLKPRAERRLMLLVGAAMALQVGLLLYLVVTKTFTTGLLFVFLINLLVPGYFLFTVWLDHKPQYRRHLTLTAEGVRYRSRFMQEEHAFDWDEIDFVDLKLYKVIFVLKNDEVHEVSLDRIQNDAVLHQVKEQIRQLVRSKEIELC
ncbi:hypothetical protein [Pontibacter actiniarum]|nr:hypothetical protein [Pontibacter actiniarum]